MTAWCAADNAGSRRVLEKTGMRFVNTEKDGLALGDRVYDGIPYEGSIVNMGVKNPDGSVRYIIGVLKAIRARLNKRDGDVIHVVIEEKEV